MDGYISRQAAIEEAQRIRWNLQMLDNTQAEDKILYGVWRLEMEIEKLPAVPVREVRRGRWIDTGSGQECPFCGEIQYGYDSLRRYCAVCGADNREEE